MATFLFHVLSKWAGSPDGLAESLSVLRRNTSAHLNKNIDAAKTWVLSGPSPIANNLQAPDAIGIHEAPVQVREDAYFLEMPAGSMAAMEISP